MRANLIQSDTGFGHDGKPSLREGTTALAACTSFQHLEFEAHCSRCKLPHAPSDCVTQTAGCPQLLLHTFDTGAEAVHATAWVPRRAAHLCQGAAVKGGGPAALGKSSGGDGESTRALGRRAGVV